MSGSQHHYGHGSNGSGRSNGYGSSRGSSYANSTWGGGASAPTTQSHGYDPSRDPTYTQVYRPWSYHPHPNGVTNGSAQNGAPPPSRTQAQQPRASNALHQFETDHSSSHLRVFPYQSSESDFHSSPPPHSSSSADRRAQPDREQYRYQLPSGSAHLGEAEYPRSEPYNAVGYVRSDGAVYDKDELYEEYRQYGQQRFNGK